jgi:hypothetical protein
MKRLDESLILWETLATHNFRRVHIIAAKSTPSPRNAGSSSKKTRKAKEAEARSAPKPSETPRPIVQMVAIGSIEADPSRHPREMLDEKAVREYAEGHRLAG